MSKFWAVLASAVFSASVFAQTVTLESVLADKVMVGEGTCDIEGATMVRGGAPTQCFAFVSPADPVHVWFVVIQNGEPTMVFMGDITGQTQLVWWKGKKDV